MTLITTSQAAEIANVSTDTIIRWCYRPDYKFTRQASGKTWVIDRDTFVEFVNNKPAAKRQISVSNATVPTDLVEENKRKMERLIANAMAGKVEALEVPANMDGKEFKQWLKTGRNSKQQAAG